MYSGTRKRKRWSSSLTLSPPRLSHHDQACSPPEHRRNLSAWVVTGTAALSGGADVRRYTKGRTSSLNTKRARLSKDNTALGGRRDGGIAAEQVAAAEKWL